jgi:ribosomal-protein-alanine N-acetyltransferase
MLNLPSLFCRHMQLEDSTDVLAIDACSFPTPMKPNLLHYELTENEIAHYQVLEKKDSTGKRSIIGFSGYWLMGDEVHISTIAVHPGQRGKHLGELLLLNMLFMAYEHPACLVTLEVRQSNRIAQQLYAKYKFDVVGERPRYYKDTGENAILMTAEPLNGRYHQFLLDQKQALLRLTSPTND